MLAIEKGVAKVLVQICDELVTVLVYFQSFCQPLPFLRLIINQSSHMRNCKRPRYRLIDFHKVVPKSRIFCSSSRKFCSQTSRQGGKEVLFVILNLLLLLLGQI